VYRHGVAATGVQAIAAEAGVAKMSLYRHFPDGKDQLVVAALADQSDRAVRSLFEAARAAVSQSATNDPLAVVLAVFDVIDARGRRPGWRGCPFLNAAAELPADHPGREIVLAHRRRLHRVLADMLASGGVGHREVDGLARALMVLVDGALVATGLTPEDRPALVARRLAASLLA
jgi:AcrR family transcriptional regulator